MFGGLSTVFLGSRFLQFHKNIRLLSLLVQKNFEIDLCIFNVGKLEHPGTAIFNRSVWAL
jgi:hypothetical protein